MDMNVLAVGLGLFATALAAASLILHKVAPMTKNTVDDKARDVVDFLKDKAVPVAQAMFPKDDSKPAAKVTGFEQPGSIVRDHRK